MFIDVLLNTMSHTAHDRVEEFTLKHAYGLHVAEPFVVGGLSAMFASSIIHPIDLSKVRLQLFSMLNPGVPRPPASKMILQIAQTEGVFALYSGLSASLMRQAVYGTARIGLHRAFSNELQRRNDGKPLPFYLKTLSGVVSGMIAVSLGTPFDVSLVRMQADSMKPVDNRRNYKHVFDALHRIVKEEGFGKLYSGLMPNVMRGVAVNVGMLACYDQAKELISQYVTNESLTGPPSLKTQMMASCVAGFTASSFSLPFDLMKSRMQDGSKYKNLLDCALSVIRNEGVLAFWTGFPAYYMRTAPHAMIVLLTQEPIAGFYKKTLYH